MEILPNKRIISLDELRTKMELTKQTSMVRIERLVRYHRQLGEECEYEDTRDFRLTKVQFEENNPTFAICVSDFNVELNSSQYKEHTFTFTQEQWDESPRTLPPVEEANAEVNPVADAVHDANEEADVVPDANEEADAVGNPDGKTFEEEAANLLNRRKNIILEGPPGTGKTYAMKGIVDALKEADVPIGKEGKDDFAITMHPATSYEDFIEGLRPGDVAGEFDYSAGVFVEKVKHAIRNPLEQHVVLLDELNRCNVPRVLGDLLTTIESGKRTKPWELPDGDDDEDRLETEGEFQFVVCSETTPDGSNFNGFRFSRDAMGLVEAGNEIKYYQNIRDDEVTVKTDAYIAGYRQLNQRQFRGEYKITHSIEPRLRLVKRTIVLIFIDDIGRPVLDSNWARYLTFGGERPENDMISVLCEDGIKKIRVWQVDFETKTPKAPGGNEVIGGKVNVVLNYPNLDCTCSRLGRDSKRYWCDNCDRKWRYDRTEITLPGSKKLFHVPNNLLVVGTMNTTDRSVAPLDAALRRRFVFLRVDRSKLSQKELRKLPEGISRTLLKDTQTLWEKLNDQLEEILGKDATIGHSYLYELRTELKNELNNDEEDERKLENLVVEFWRYSVLPQVADLLDATGKASDIWDSIGLEQNFNSLGLTMNTGKKKYRTFSRTIVELTEPGPQPQTEPGTGD